MIEIQGDWICEAMLKMSEQRILSIEANADAACQWREDIQNLHQQSLFPVSVDQTCVTIGICAQAIPCTLTHADSNHTWVVYRIVVHRREHSRETC